MQQFYKKHFLIILLLAACTFITVISGRIIDNRWPTGDEPNYAMMARSLYVDHDLNIKNNFEDNKYIGSIVNVSLEPQINHKYFTNQSPKWYSIHNFGLGFLLVPAFILSATTGIWLVYAMAIFMTLYSCLSIIACYFYCLTITQSKRAAILGSLALLSCLSFSALGASAFPDIPSAALIITSATSVLLLKRGFKNDWILYAVASATAALTVLLHVKNLLAAITILGVALYLWLQSKRTVKTAVALFIPPIIILGIFAYLIHNWFLTWNILAPFSNGQLFQLNPLTSLLASLLDVNKGIIPNNPILLLVFVGLPLWWKRDRDSMLLACMIILPSLIIQGSFNDWAGGYSPAGRYLMTLIFLFIPAISFAYTALKKNKKAYIFWILLLIQAAVTLTYLFKHPQWNYAGDSNPLFIGILNRLGLAKIIANPIFTYNLQLRDPKQVSLLTILLPIIAICICFSIGIKLISTKDNSR